MATDRHARMKELRAILGAHVAKSVTSSSGVRTVERPVEAARYVVNMLTAHHLALLAELAVTFAPTQVMAFMQEQEEADRASH